MAEVIRIGTRDSKLALFQAERVQALLSANNLKTELVPVKSEGDLNLTQPLYELGIHGIFTKSLDIALLNDEVDIAVHSLKDIPTSTARGLMIAAVLERDAPEDVLVIHPDKSPDDVNGDGLVIGTSSLRRKAQWMHKYPMHRVEPIRGNVIRRLEKIRENDWFGAIFSKAGLDRLSILPEKHILLDWMVPAPAQGTIAVMCREKNTAIREQLERINHKITQETTWAERMFLRTLEAGCTAPVGAFASAEAGGFKFTGNVCSVDGKKHLTVTRTFPGDAWQTAGQIMAAQILDEGAQTLLV